jgi:plasmid stabilization system protein ParE
MPIKWTKTGLRFVHESASFIANDNPTRATSFVQELLGAVSKLQAHSGRGRAGRAPGARKLGLHKKIIAICRVRDDDVEIFRLHHAARNL